MTDVRAMAQAASQASRALQTLPSEARAAALERIGDALWDRRAEILKANAADVADGERAVAEGRLSAALAARLGLTERGLAGLRDGLRAIAAQPEPLGRVRSRTELAAGLVLRQETAALGVLLVIFEARPNALPQIAGLALRSGNGLLLKGGSEAARSNRVLHRVWCDALAPLPAASLGLVESREDIASLLALDDVIDLVIPRGSNALVRHIQAHTRIPVLGHADGICHVYVDAAADPDKAEAIVIDSKTDYPAACNAMETLLVHRSLVGGLADRLLATLQAAGVVVHRGPNAPWPDLPEAPSLAHEYSDYACTIEVVDDVGAAMDHVARHGSGHTDCVVTDDPAVAARWLAEVDSACVFHDASTRFADGFRFGLGAEVGISTGRIHARGPVGVEGLLTTRFKLEGSGHTVAPFTRGEQAFTHRKLD